jgi:hypothetical protein
MNGLMKVKIFTMAFNRPDLLQQQIDSLNKNLEDDDYQLQVVYDTSDNQYLEEFTSICDENGINLYHHQSEPGKTASYYNSDSIQWIYDTTIRNYDENCIVLFLDHDMFLIDSFNINNFMQEYDLAGPVQSRGSVSYVWPGLLFFKKDSLIGEEFDFYPKQVQGHFLDSCGGTHTLIDNPRIKYFSTDIQYPDEYGDIDLKEVDEGYGFELHLEQKFLHFRNASGWHKNFDVSKVSVKKNTLNHILENVNG